MTKIVFAVVCHDAETKRVVGTVSDSLETAHEMARVYEGRASGTVKIKSLEVNV